ncbi:MAG: hypothetical protein RBT76_09755 [candidate division Zixibacteria bacterium]|nr:hypothetical protein [candidate division Zixibacteria bacterium]
MSGNRTKFEQFALAGLPPTGKLFVGIFTTLMLLICLWAVFIFYVDKGIIDEDSLPLYLTKSMSGAPASGERALQEDIDVIMADSQAVLAPIWDSAFAGREATADSATLDVQFHRTDERVAKEAGRFSREPEYGSHHEHLRRNVGLAHTHINGQTLLFFALGLVFLFSSASVKVKKTVLWIFGIVILLHAIGLSGEGFGSLFDDILAVSGVAILVVIAYMALMIYIDLGRKADEN